MEITVLEIASREKPDDRRIPLAKPDWLAAGLQVLVDEGIEAVQITRLARELGVTRGSFYWHFGDRGDLLTAMIAEWRHLNSGIMKAALAGAPSLTDGILALFSVWTDSEPFSPRLDRAMRDWANRSDSVKQTVAAEDDSRVDAIAAFFCKFGFEVAEAFARARVIYFTQVTYYALDIEEALTDRMEALEIYFRCFTGLEIDPDAADAFRKKLFDERADK
jgi:AcrR family transcriptional regulator